MLSARSGRPEARGKHPWLTRGMTFHQLHLLLDKHAAEQLELIDLITAQVQTLGGVSPATC